MDGGCSLITKGTPSVDGRLTVVIGRVLGVHEFRQKFTANSCMQLVIVRPECTYGKKRNTARNAWHTTQAI